MDSKQHQQCVCGVLRLAHRLRAGVSDTSACGHGCIRHRSSIWLGIVQRHNSFGTTCRAEVLGKEAPSSFPHVSACLSGWRGPSYIASVSQYEQRRPSGDPWCLPARWRFRGAGVSATHATRQAFQSDCDRRLHPGRRASHPDVAVPYGRSRSERSTRHCASLSRCVSSCSQREGHFWWHRTPVS